MLNAKKMYWSNIFLWKVPRIFMAKFLLKNVSLQVYTSIINSAYKKRYIFSNSLKQNIYFLDNIFFIILHTTILLVNCFFFFVHEIYNCLYIFRWVSKVVIILWHPCHQKVCKTLFYLIISNYSILFFVRTVMHTGLHRGDVFAKPSDTPEDK